MEVVVDGTGRRIFINSPYVDQSEWKHNVVLYDPNGYNIGTGLYDRPLPAAERWVDHVHEDQMLHHRRPMAVMDADGRRERGEDFYHLYFPSGTRVMRYKN